MYRRLYEFWLREKASPDIQEVPSDLYKLIADYITDIVRKSRMLDKGTVEADLIKHEESEVNRIAKDLVRLRLEKILTCAARDEVVAANLLTPEEKEFYDRLKDPLTYQKTLRSVIRGGFSGVEEGVKEGKNKLLRFMKDVPTIVGVDLKKYGPFKSEDIAYIPAESAEVLIKRGAAMEVKR